MRHRMASLVLKALLIGWLLACSTLTAPTSSPTPSPFLPRQEVPSTQAPPSPSASPPTPASPTPPPPPTATSSFSPSVVRFAIIGDYGTGGSGEAAVARLVKAWQPDFILTTGDNNLLHGDPQDLDAHVGRFFGDYIRQGRFFPALGNHDWDYGDLSGYLAYFHPPGNGRYYEFTAGPVHFFVLDSDPREPDGNTADSRQAQWLRERLMLAQEPWRLVVLHHSPYSSGFHGSTQALQWPYAAWGVDAVIGGHDHTYERILRDGMVYFVNGLGGNGRYEFPHEVPGSQVRYNDLYGALRVEASATYLRLQFINIQGETIDTYTLLRP